MVLKFKHGFIVSIDGPAGAGKSTVSRQLAEALGGVLLDTGAMYRAVAYFAVKEGCKTAKELGAIARRLAFDVERGTNALLVNGENLGLKLRGNAASRMASSVSRYKSVRASLTRRQRSLGIELSRRLPVVVEGRDIGTVVFPKARFKFYVTASPEVRAERRVKELRRHGVKGATFKGTLREIEARDNQDTHRKLAPLKCPEGAVVVDTSTMGIVQVVHFMTDHIRNVESLRHGG